MYIYIYICLWPSRVFFRKTACIQAHHMCYRRAHLFFFFFPVLCLTCSIITPILHVDVCVRQKKTNRERERERTKRRKEIEYRMCIMKKRRMFRLHRFLVTGYEKKKRRCKKDFFLLPFAYLYVPIIIIEIYIHLS